MEAAFARAQKGNLEAPGRTAVAVWQRFRRRFMAAVWDCNGEAGEAIWAISEDAGEPWRLEIRSAAVPFERLELFFEPAQMRLCCSFGRSAIETWRFEMLPDGSGLRRETKVLSIEDSINIILDRLAGIALSS